MAARGSPKAGAKATSLVPLALASALAFFLLDWGWRATLASRAIATGATRFFTCSSMFAAAFGEWSAQAVRDRRGLIVCSSRGRTGGPFTCCRRHTPPSAAGFRHGTLRRCTMRMSHSRLSPPVAD